MSNENTGKLLLKLLRTVLKENREIKADLDQLNQRLKILEDRKVKSPGWGM